MAASGGTSLVLAQGNSRIQAFDSSANPVLAFKGGTTSLMPLVPDSGAIYLDLGVEALAYMYVLSYISDGTLPANYRLDVYTPDGAFLSRTSGVPAARLAVDLFRNVYTLNYEAISGSPRVEPSLSQWLPQSAASTCPSTLPSRPDDFPHASPAPRPHDRSRRTARPRGRWSIASGCPSQA
ncbi:MAG: hypothetical protein EOP82_29785 [Variovorax sp.]|nr:MAG: hypothetical protein EOP82_29785 [Variovorax sp.]